MQLQRGDKGDDGDGDGGEDVEAVPEKRNKVHIPERRLKRDAVHLPVEQGGFVLVKGFPEDDEEIKAHRKPEPTVVARVEEKVVRVRLPPREHLQRLQGLDTEQRVEDAEAHVP